MMMDNKQIQKLLKNDPYTPRYHFIAPEGACMPFDPNGALYWKGRYHLFYIFQDAVLPDGGHCWGHASSADLLHWQYHRAALVPAADDVEYGIFSGNAFIDKDGVPTIAYLGCGAGICIAQAQDDDLIEWKKSEHNPVIPLVKEGDAGWGVYWVHDPHVWVEGEWYHAILNSRVQPYNRYDTAYLFRSQNLADWDYVRPFYQPNTHWTGEDEDCACPDFFELDGRHALLCISHPRGARCYLGRYTEGTFVPEEHYRMNWPGGTCFAPESLLDDQGRRLFWSWVLDQRRIEGKGLGVMSMPRQLSLDAEKKLRVTPAVELENLRQNHRHHEGFTVSDGEEMTLEGMGGDVMELSLTVCMNSPAELGVKVRVAEDRSEETVIWFDGKRGTVTIDTRRTCREPERVYQFYPIFHIDAEDQRDVREQQAEMEMPIGKPFEIRLFLDVSMLEVFVDGGRLCMTQRIYPDHSSLAAAVTAKGGDIEIVGVDAWDMETTNK